MTCSYIVAIDNTYPLVTNFIEQLINVITSNDEIIIVLDACNNMDTISYLEKAAKKNSQIKLIHLEKKVGFSGSNNIGIKTPAVILLFLLILTFFLKIIVLKIC